MMLAPWRDLAIVWLALLTMLFVAVPGLVLFYALRYLRRFKRWLRLPLLNAQLWALRIQHTTTRASNVVVALPIGLSSASARARVTARGVADFLLGR